MLQSTQFLNILAAEAEHLVTVSIFLPKDVSQEIIHRLTEAFASDNFSDAAKAWNDERALIVQEVVEKQLLPLGVKWTKEYVREEVEDYLANRCAESLTYVRELSLLLKTFSFCTSASTPLLTSRLTWRPVKLLLF